MRANARRSRLLGVAMGLMVALPAAGEEALGPPPRNENTYMQVWLGGLGTDDSWELDDAQSGESVLGDLGTLPFGGGAGQRLWGDVWQIGYEGGALGTWKSDDTRFRGVNGNLDIKIDSTYFSVGVFMGGVVSVSPHENVRLYVAAGPSATWAWVEEGDDDDDVGTTTVEFENNANDVSVVPYARAGLEIVLDDGFSFGVSVRYADDEFDFDESGELELDEPLWMLTLGGRF